MSMQQFPETMRAVVLRAPRQFAVEDVPVPRPQEPDDVVCKVNTTFICGTDPHIINGDYPGFWPPSFPFIPGHEWSAVIVESGTRARSLGWLPGDRVCAISHCGCGYCRNCLKGRYNLCLNYGHEDRGHRQYGHRTPGAYAEYVRASVKSLIKVPDGFDLSRAACVDPLSIALYTVKRTRMQPGDDLLIMGAGPQGLMATLVGKALGAGRIIAVGSGARLELAKSLGAIPIDYKSGNVVEQVRELTNGLGAPEPTAMMRPAPSALPTSVAIKPCGPAPMISRSSPGCIRVRFTVYNAMLSGSTQAARSRSKPSGTRIRLFTDARTYSAYAPGVRCPYCR